MDADQIAVARTCLHAAHDGSMAFPAIIGALLDAGFEGYAVDYRTGAQTFFRPDGGHVALPLPACPGSVAARFDAAEVAALVAWAQSGDAGYSFAAFSTCAKAAGCAGYLVSFPGRRVLYYGRTAETHVEHFPG